MVPGDILPGFSEFFSDLKLHDVVQVWSGLDRVLMGMDEYRRKTGYCVSGWVDLGLIKALVQKTML